MKIEKKLNKHNNMVIKLHDDANGTIFSRTGERFSYKATNMFLTEMKVNDPNKPKKIKREFIISIRADGLHNNYKMTQMDFSEDELIELKDNINEMLTYKNKKYVSQYENNFKDLTGKRSSVWFNPYYLSEERRKACSIESKIDYVEGYMENFNPQTGIILFDKEFGFNIIPFKSIIQILEIKEGE